MFPAQNIEVSFLKWSNVYVTPKFVVMLKNKLWMVVYVIFILKGRV